MRAMNRKRNEGTPSTSEINSEESPSSDDDDHLETVSACKLFYNWFLFHLQSGNHKHEKSSTVGPPTGISSTPVLHLELF